MATRLDCVQSAFDQTIKPGQTSFPEYVERFMRDRYPEFNEQDLKR